VGNGFITEEQISETLAQQLHIPFINLKFYNINWDVVRRLLVSDARFYRAIALEMRGDQIVVGMTDPTDVRAQQEIAALLKCQITVAVVTEGQLLETFERIY
jgi:MSHA biogenesis protein MshE